VILESNPHLSVALYTDEDVTADLAPALRLRGYIAQSTVEAGNAEISDEAQLIYAAEQGMAILTYNTQHFISLARVWYASRREYTGIIVSEQFSQRQFGELLQRVLRLLNRLLADEIHNRVVFLQQFK
jgi:hypothetical protein